MADANSIPCSISSPKAKSQAKCPISHRRSCAKYERTTKRGFLMRVYRNMQSRVSGVQKLKHHLYEGKELLDRSAFYAWSLGSPAFNAIFDAWLAAGHVRRIAPSIDRINAAGGYELSNMRWVEFHENCRNIQRKRTSRRDRSAPRKPTTAYVQMMLGF